MSRATEEAFARGYQEALADLIDAHERDGAPGVYAWLRDNVHDVQRRALIASVGAAAAQDRRTGERK